MNGKVTPATRRRLGTGSGTRVASQTLATLESRNPICEFISRCSCLNPFSNFTEYRPTCFGGCDPGHDPWEDGAGHQSDHCSSCPDGSKHRLGNSLRVGVRRRDSVKTEHGHVEASQRDSGRPHLVAPVNRPAGAQLGQTTRQVRPAATVPAPAANLFFLLPRNVFFIRPGFKSV